MAIQPACCGVGGGTLCLLLRLGAAMLCGVLGGLFGVHLTFLLL